MGKLDGKVAFITGAARGQGRAHAVRLASEGADIIAIDICGPIAASCGEPSTTEDLEETANLVEKLDRRIVTAQADVRDFDGLSAALDDGIAQLGRLDIVAANAGCWGYNPYDQISPEDFREIVDICLVGVWHTCKAAGPHMVRQGQGGSIIITSSSAGLIGYPNLAHYVAAKHGAIGLMKTLAIELAPHRIRVNAICPGAVNTKMNHNKATYDLFAPDLVDPTVEQIAARFQTLALLPEPWLDPEDIAAMVAFLASDDARFITGAEMKVDLGALVKPPGMP